MKKIYLQKITQYGTECYIGKIDPRSLVRVAEKIEMSAVQDAQRPLNEKRVKSIANYVDGDKGILPNTLTINREIEDELVSNPYHFYEPVKGIEKTKQ